MTTEKPSRSKKFISTDSLWYEEERLNTFIDWPVIFISPDELASNGFYYLRTKDHCACAFCLGIIGAWEEGDSILGEHKRHFPHCPLINGSPTPNVPLMHGNIIAKLNRKNTLSCEKEQHDAGTPVGEDVCGTGREFNQKQNIVIGGDESSEIALTNLGIPMYSGPKKKEYLTYESRLSTFKDWPEKVSVTPQNLADAGFFYIGLSDHVRCFHCGNGLRNWEPNDSAWEEHARWYPECHFILVKRGAEFVDKVRRTNPPYIHSPPNQPSVYFSKGAKYNKFSITDGELSRLMDLQVIKATSDMGFSQCAIKAALKKKLQQTGVPFFKLDQCIEAVLQVTQEEKQAIEDESLSNQANKIAMYQNAGTSNEIQQETVSNSDNTSSSADVARPTVEIPQEEASLPVLPPRDRPTRIQPEDSFPSTSQQLPTGTPILNEAMEEDVESATTHSDPESVGPDDPTESNDESPDPAQQTLSLNTESKESPPSLQNANKEDLLAEADEIIKAAKVLLEKDSLSSSGHSSLESLHQIDDLSGKIHPNSVTADDLTKELERIKDGRTCRVCMDTEMEVVFLPCTHMTACSSCAVTLSTCPICRGNIQYVIKPIIS